MLFFLIIAVLELSKKAESYPLDLAKTCGFELKALWKSGFSLDEYNRPLWTCEETPYGMKTG